MNEITLVIPAKDEPNALPLVLNEINKKKMPIKVLKECNIFKPRKPWHEADFG